MSVLSLDTLVLSGMYICVYVYVCVYANINSIERKRQIGDYPNKHFTTQKPWIDVSELHKMGGSTDFAVKL